MQSESFMSTRLTNVPSSVGLSSSESDCCIVEEACCGVSRAESTFQIGLGNHGCCVLQAKEVMDWLLPVESSKASICDGMWVNVHGQWQFIIWAKGQLPTAAFVEGWNERPQKRKKRAVTHSNQLCSYLILADRLQCRPVPAALNLFAFMSPVFCIAQLTSLNWHCPWFGLLVQFVRAPLMRTGTCCHSANVSF